MLKNNMNFYEAVSFLAEQAGIAIPSDTSPVQKEMDRERESLRRINSLAKDFFITPCSTTKPLPLQGGIWLAGILPRRCSSFFR